MILRIDGDLKPYYAQTLCMIFFPGVRFPENELPAPNVPEAYFGVTCDGNLAKAQVRVSLGDKTETRVGECAAEAEIDLAKARQIAAGAAFYEAASALTGMTICQSVLPLSNSVAAFAAETASADSMKVKNFLICISFYIYCFNGIIRDKAGVPICLCPAED